MGSLPLKLNSTGISSVFLYNINFINYKFLNFYIKKTFAILTLKFD